MRNSSYSLLQEAINYEYYKDRIDQETFNKLVALDPTSEKKYARWIVECWIRNPSLGPVWKQLHDYLKLRKEWERNPQGQFGPERPNVNNGPIVRFWGEDAQKITNDLKSYTKLKNKKLLQPNEMNLLNIKSYSDLWRLVQSHENELSEMEEIDPSEYEKWYEDNAWLVVIPKTHRASCKYGANTRWCTTYRDDTSYYDQYSKDGPLIIIIKKPSQIAMGDTAKGEGGRKWQIHLESDQWMDEKDNPIENKIEFTESLPKPILLVLYQKTKNFLFRPDKKEYIIKELSTPNGFNTIHNWLTARYFLSALQEKYPNADLTDFLNRKLYVYAYENVSFDEGWDDDGSYSYGYNHPWEYLKKSKPEGIPENSENFTDEEDPEMWSEEQRGEAASEAESKSRDYWIEQSAREYDYQWRSNRYDSNLVEKIYDAYMTNFFSMKYYKEETIQTTLNLLNLFTDHLEELGEKLSKVDKARVSHRRFD